jgi:hypothetical protein
MAIQKSKHKQKKEGAKLKLREPEEMAVQEQQQYREGGGLLLQERQLLQEDLQRSQELFPTAMTQDAAMALSTVAARRVQLAMMSAGGASADSTTASSASPSSYVMHARTAVRRANANASRSSSAVFSPDHLSTSGAGGGAIKSDGNSTVKISQTDTGRSTTTMSLSSRSLNWNNEHSCTGTGTGSRDRRRRQQQQQQQQHALSSTDGVVYRREDPHPCSRQYLSKPSSYTCHTTLPVPAVRRTWSVGRASVGRLIGWLDGWLVGWLIG